MESMLASVLVLGCYRQTITVIRSLGRAGYRVTLGLERGEPSYLGSSRYVSRVWAHPDLHHEQEFLAALQAFLESEKTTGLPCVIFPVGEGQIQFVARHASQLANYAQLVIPDPKLVFHCLDKSQLIPQVQTLGIPLPPTSEFTSTHDWKNKAQAFGYPVVIKYKDSNHLFGGRKAYIVSHSDEFAQVLAEEKETLSGAILQKFVKGSRHNFHFMAVKGEITELFQQVVIRTDAPDQTGFGVEGMSVPLDPAGEKYCRSLVNALPYDGVGCVQFLVDEGPQGRSYWFLELNPRLDATCGIAYACGVDFPKIAVEHSLGQYCSTKKTPYPTQKTFYWLYGDFTAVLHDFRTRHLSLSQVFGRLIRMGMMTVMASHHLVWSISDPLPSLVLWFKELPASLTRGLRSRVFGR